MQTPSTDGHKDPRPASARQLNLIECDRMSIAPPLYDPFFILFLALVKPSPRVTASFSWAR